ncbi:MAG: Clp protease N-terminal domain-containing protein, partial [Atribacterota bacterium]|nr:Clp protease N-terminal domain-containing protein [Atribacterota bacterium]
MFKRYTEKVRKVIMMAQEEAVNLNHNYIGTEHILVGLVKENEGLAGKVLRELGVEPEKVIEAIEKIVGKGEYQEVSEITFTPRAKKVLELASQEASQLGQNYIGTEHILLGLIKEGSGVATRILNDMGIDLENVYSQVMKVLMENGQSEPTVANSITRKDSKVPTLDEFGRDLTELAMIKEANKRNVIIHRAIITVQGSTLVDFEELKTI